MAIGRPPIGEWLLTWCEAKHRIPLLSDSATNTSCRRPPHSICKVWPRVRRNSGPCLGAQIAVLVRRALGKGCQEQRSFSPVRFGRVRGAALASHCVLQQRSTRSFGRGTVDQTKVDGRFTPVSSATISWNRVPPAVTKCHLGRAPGIQTKN